MRRADFTPAESVPRLRPPAMRRSSLQDLFRPELASLHAYRVPPEPPAVKLDANESPWLLPGEAWEQVLAAIHRIDLHRYPDGNAAPVRAALARTLSGDPDQFVLGAGSDELIALVATAMSNPRSGQEQPVVLCPEPTFVMYRLTSIAHGWRAVGVPLDERWDLDVDAMSDALERERPNVVYYARPNNPTGNAFSRDRIEALVEAYPDTLHVIDEAYVAFAPDSMSSFCLERPHCALLGTLSKIGFAAIRVGWLRLHAELAAELEKVRQPFNVNALSQAVATLALTELAPMIHAQARAVRSERTRLVDRIGQLSGFEVFPSDANFLLIRTPGSVESLREQLLEQEIAVRRFGPGYPRLAQCIRITVGTPAENDRLIEALEAIA